MKKYIKIIFLITLMFLFKSNVFALDEFSCYLSKNGNDKYYEIVYNENGAILKVNENGEQMGGEYFSEFTPKNESECFDDSVAEVSVGEEVSNHIRIWVRSIDFENYKTKHCIDYNELDSKQAAEKGCNNGTERYACVWNEEYQFCNIDTLVFVECGGATDIPVQVPQLISFAVNLLKILTPIILIVVGMITLIKAIVASREDEIKKAQSSLVKKLIASALVFFVVTIVQFVILKIADGGDADGIDSCMNCFLNNNCEATAYYKANIGGKDYCYQVNSNEQIDCDTGKKSHGGGGGKF